MPIAGEHKAERVEPEEYLSDVRDEALGEDSSMGPVKDVVAPPSPVSSSADSVDGDADADADADVDPDTAMDAAVPSVKSIVLLDYDDTLLSSSHLAGLGHTLDSDAPFGTELETELEQLAQTVRRVLETAMSMGTVVLVTNAEAGWIELSCQRFMPSVWPLVSQLQRISARSTFEAAFPNSPLRWKINAMHDQVSRVLRLRDGNFQLLSFGDSACEREASRYVGQQFGLTVKSVKFCERPNIAQLQRQLELVCSCFSSIVTHDGALDLMLSLSN